MRIRQAVESVGGAGVDSELPGIACRQPTRMHEQAVIEEGIPGADGEQSRTQVLKLTLQRRNVRVMQVMCTRQKSISKLHHVDGAQKQPFVTKGPRTGRQVHVEQAEIEVGP